MDNRIEHVTVRQRQLDPAQAELRVSVRPAARTAATEVHGRLTGPRCPFASTVEVAYPLRPVAGEAGDEVLLRVVIPEPTLWDPVCPFLYAGAVELWEGGRRCGQVPLSHGLRVLALGPRGLRLNGRPLALRGRAVGRFTEDDALALRRSGHNLLLADAGDGAVWDLADRLGFLVLGRVARADDDTQRRLGERAGRPSCLGWLAPAPDVAAALAGRPADPAGGGWVGLEADALPAGPLPAGVRFLAGLAAADPSAALPRLVPLGGAAFPEGPAPDGVLGWVG
jgi:hypothetical protein